MAEEQVNNERDCRYAGCETRQIAGRKYESMLPVNIEDEERARAAIDNYMMHNPLSPMCFDYGRDLHFQVVMTELGLPLEREKPFEGMQDAVGMGEALKLLLKDSGKSLSDVAELMGVSKSTVSRWIKNIGTLSAHKTYNLLMAIACVTWTGREVIEEAFMRVGRIVRSYLSGRLPEVERDRLKMLYEIERLAGVLDTEALEILVSTARAFIGPHVSQNMVEELESAERAIDAYAAYVEREL